MAACLIASSSAAVAGEAMEQLRYFVEKLASFEASFDQRMLDGERQEISRSTGVMALQRPGRFRWDYKTPYEQVIVADGQKIWIYDSDLEQVTVKPLDDTLGSMPSLLLSGGLPLEQNFAVRELPPQDGKASVRLEPKDTAGNFESVTLTFNESGLSSMELIDSFGQATEFVFHDVQTNPQLDPEIFRFVPPPGVDVVGG